MSWTPARRKIVLFPLCLCSILYSPYLRLKSPLKVNRRFRGTCRFHLQFRKRKPCKKHTTRSYISEDGTLRNYHCENLKSHYILTHCLGDKTAAAWRKSYTSVYCWRLTKTGDLPREINWPQCQCYGSWLKITRTARFQKSGHRIGNFWDIKFRKFKFRPLICGPVLDEGSVSLAFKACCPEIQTKYEYMLLSRHQNVGKIGT
jgi:hypothetical protein